MAYNYDYDDEGINFLYPLSAFFALGIWLVISRYHSIRNRAVPFVHRPPLVSLDISKDIFTRCADFRLYP